MGMTPPEVARVRYALDTLEQHLPEEHRHIRRALQFIMVCPFTGGFDPSVRAYTATNMWGRGMVFVHRPSAMPITEIAVSISHEARHFVRAVHGGYIRRDHAFGRRVPTSAERQADPIYARDDEIRHVLSRASRPASSTGRSREPTERRREKNGGPSSSEARLQRRPQN